MDKQVLIVDIETAPLITMVWNLGKQYVTKDQVLEDWHILAFSAKWLNEPASKIIYMETRNGDDTPLLKKLWELLNKADIVITQNGKKFDEPRIKARMMLTGMKPYKPFEHHDTFLQNKDKEFTSHSLDYLTDKFCIKYKKLKHKNFPGLSLWKECRKNNNKAWAEMQKYNNWDVLSTEELYLNTRGWAKKSAPEAYHPSAEKCGTCGENRLEKRGYRINARGRFQRYQCMSCGKWSVGGKL